MLMIVVIIIMSRRREEEEQSESLKRLQETRIVATLVIAHMKPSTAHAQTVEFRSETLTNSMSATLYNGCLDQPQAMFPMKQLGQTG